MSDTEETQDGIASRVPFDYESIEKGDLFPASEIETITNKKRGTVQYQFALMGLQAAMSLGLEDLGKSYTVKIHQDGLQVLTDIEATEYNDRRFRSSFRGMLKAHFRQMGVDESQLDDPDVRAHQHRLFKQGKIIMGAKAGQDDARRMIAAQRTTPNVLAGRTEEAPAPIDTPPHSC